MAAVRRLSERHHIADYSFISFWIIELILNILKIENRLPVLVSVCVWGGGGDGGGRGTGWEGAYAA